MEEEEEEEEVVRVDFLEEQEESSGVSVEEEDGFLGSTSLSLMWRDWTRKSRTSFSVSFCWREENKMMTMTVHYQEILSFVSFQLSWFDCSLNENKLGKMTYYYQEILYFVSFKLSRFYWLHIVNRVNHCMVPCKEIRSPTSK